MTKEQQTTSFIRFDTAPAKARLQVNHAMPTYVHRKPALSKKLQREASTKTAVCVKTCAKMTTITFFSCEVGRGAKGFKSRDHGHDAMNQFIQLATCKNVAVKCHAQDDIKENTHRTLRNHKPIAIPVAQALCYCFIRICSVM